MRITGKQHYDFFDESTQLIWRKGERGMKERWKRYEGCIVLK